jgi:hypothetical protein
MIFAARVILMIEGTMNRFVTICVLLLIAGSIQAQNSARITTMTFHRGDATGRFTLFVQCNGTVMYELTRSQMRIQDNGMPIDDFSIVESSSPAQRTPFSAALVLDASGSMSGVPNFDTKAAAHAFVGLMDSVSDEAAIFWFNSLTTLQQGMTIDRAMLDAAIDQLPATGATAVYDAIYAGLVHVNSNASNTKRAIVVLTDGGDNSSVHSPSEVIQYALQVDVRVFVIALGGMVNQTEMQNIAQQTGGEYLASPTSSQLQTLFMQVASFMGRGFDEHVIVMKTPAADAGEHELQVTVLACSETATATKTEEASGTTPVGHALSAIPLRVELGQNVPNPVISGSDTRISYRFSGVMHPVQVRLCMYDLLGRRVAVLVDREQEPGAYDAVFRSGSLPSGVYMYRLDAGSDTQVRKLVIHR